MDKDVTKAKVTMILKLSPLKKCTFIEAVSADLHELKTHFNIVLQLLSEVFQVCVCVRVNLKTICWHRKQSDFCQNVFSPILILV